MNSAIRSILLSLTMCVVTASSQSLETVPSDFSLYASTLRFQLRGYPLVTENGDVLQEFASGHPMPIPAVESGPSRRSPVLAGALSLLLPGAGEIYAQSYVLGATFIALETAGWFLNIGYNKKGDDATAYFQEYADTHWSAVRYAKWLNTYAHNFEGSDDRLIQIPIDETTPGLQEWQRVNWSTMNTVEAAIPVFSHRLPQHGEQQYFELIGKYDQYSYGWDDKTTTSDGWSDYRTISANFHSYSLQRGHANDQYNMATTIASLIVLNHILSAADAAWAAARFNQHIEFHSRFMPRQRIDGSIELLPTATLSWNF